MLYDQVADVPQAMRHYQQAIQHQEALGELYGAGVTRFNIALLLAGEGRTGDALLYARAAHTNYQAVGPSAADRVARVAELIEVLERISG